MQYITYFSAIFILLVSNFSVVAQVEQPEVASQNIMADQLIAANGKWEVKQSKKTVKTSSTTPSVTNTEETIQLYTYNSQIPLPPLSMQRAQDIIYIDKQGKWANVRIKGGVPGWVVSTAAKQLPDNRVEIARDKAKIYISPSLKSRYLVSLPQGYDSVVIANTGQWLQIEAPSWVKLKMPMNQYQAIMANKISTQESGQKTNVAQTVVPQLVDVTEEDSSTSESQTDSTTNTTDQTAIAGQSTNAKNVPIQEIETQAVTTQAVKPETPSASASVASQVNTNQSGNFTYLLTPGDVISISVFGEPDMTLLNQRIPENGLISFPLIGQISIKDKTAASVEALIADKLSSGYLRDPKVNLVITAYRPLYVRGAVTTPGSYDYTEGLTIAKVLTTAGGVSRTAVKDTIKLYRNDQLFLQNLTIDSQTLIQPGDIITVEESVQVSEEANQFIYLHGEVNKPGGYTYRKGLTVEKAVALAGGFSPRASKRKIGISREVPGQEKPEQLKKVELYLDLKPGDVINVGASWF